MKKALIIVDLQNDFLPGGALPVPNGHEVIPVVNAVQHHFNFIVATKDWHPKDHGSFAVNHPGKKTGDVVTLNGIQQILWPAHCVQGTHGAEFAKDFDATRVTHVFHKGTDPTIDSYSTFFDNAHLRSTGLGEFLKEQGIDTVYISGLATDYCVKFSVLDARHLGFKVYVIEDACRGIELKPGDVEKSFQEMKEVGAKIIQSKDL